MLAKGDDHDPDAVFTSEENAKLALNSTYADGDVSKAIELLTFFSDAYDGKLVPITHTPPLSAPSTTLLSPFSSTVSSGSACYNRLVGGDNYKGISCYLDSLLFAMFARLDSFEPILYKRFEKDENRDNFATLLRVYVNMLRSGKHMTPDITKLVLESIFDAGWHPSASRYEQQDCSELFAFITEKLNMPLLTLKMDIAHGGKEVKEDDHRLINESLLHVPVPGMAHDVPILLEECLEQYFSNSIQVSRQLERRRTLDVGDAKTVASIARKYSLHIETVELSSVLSEEPKQNEESAITLENEEAVATPSSANPPSYDSLFSRSIAPTSSPATRQAPPLPSKSNPLWTPNMELTLPAWMFLQLLPFYTDERRKSADNVESTQQSPILQYFAKTRPVLGICLKRYSWTGSGNPVRNDRLVVVPQTISFPSFVADDNQDADGNVFGSFKLVLESAVFHRGSKITSGHFVALAAEDSHIGYESNGSEEKVKRSKSLWRSRSSKGSRSSNNGEILESEKVGGRLSFDSVREVKGARKDSARRWLLYDDMNPDSEKVKIVDFEEVFTKECPYLLFYRMVPIDEEKREESSEAPSPSIGLSARSSLEGKGVGGEIPELIIGGGAIKSTPVSYSDESTGKKYNSILSKAGIRSRPSSPERKKMNESGSNSNRFSLDLDYERNKLGHEKKKGRVRLRSERDRYRDEKCVIM